jgi:hypothetical protein
MMVKIRKVVIRRKGAAIFCITEKEIEMKSFYRGWFLPIVIRFKSKTTIDERVGISGII